MTGMFVYVTLSMRDCLVRCVNIFQVLISVFSKVEYEQDAIVHN